MGSVLVQISNNRVDRDRVDGCKCPFKLGWVLPSKVYNTIYECLVIVAQCTVKEDWVEEGIGIVEIEHKMGPWIHWLA
jgi:hypothetical protein